MCFSCIYPLSPFPYDGVMPAMVIGFWNWSVSVFVFVFCEIYSWFHAVGAHVLPVTELELYISGDR